MLSRSNYEIYFLDFYDGNLTESQRRELMAFLDQNPDLKEEFDGFVNVFVEPDVTTTFSNKESLKKTESINQQNYKTWLVAYFEQDLTATQMEEVNRFLDSNPSCKTDLDLIRQTRIVPDTRIVFKNKSSLRKGGKVISISSLMNRSMAVAATILLLFVSIYIFRQHRNSNSEVAEKNARPVVLPPVKINPKDSVNDNLNRESMEKQLPGAEKKPAQLFAANEKKSFNSSGQKIQPEVESPLTSSEVVQQIPEKQDTVDKMHQSTTEPSYAQNNIPVVRGTPSEQDLRKVFSEEDMKDLGLTSNSPAQSVQSDFWTLASKGAHQLSKSTGKEISLQKSRDVVDDATTYALALGKFSISHTKSVE
ncbi:MAG TPA: hypothetical protein PLU53_02440 [Bacteroidia bacterium]|nr:hypothetical protein [Bacteroidia bacterium]